MLIAALAYSLIMLQIVLLRTNGNGPNGVAGNRPTTCPAFCSCLLADAKRSNEWTTNCRNKIKGNPGFARLPRGISPDTIILRLDGNKLTGLKLQTDFDTTDFVKLRELSLRNCGIGQLPMGAFAGLSKLLRLDLSYNFISEHQLKDGNLKNLAATEEINLTKNNLSVLPARSFRGMHALRRIILVRNNIQFISDNAFDGLHKLVFISLEENVLKTLTPGPFKILPNLNSLVLDFNPWFCDCKLRPLVMWLYYPDVQVSEGTLQPRYPTAPTKRFGVNDVPFCVGPPENADKLLDKIAPEEYACAPILNTSLPDTGTTQMVELGQNTSLICDAYGDPTPSIRWEFRPNKLRHIDNPTRATLTNRTNLAISTTQKQLAVTSRLVVARIREQDLGQYHCIAWNTLQQVNFIVYSLQTSESIRAMNGPPTTPSTRASADKPSKSATHEPNDNRKPNPNLPNPEVTAKEPNTKSSSVDKNWLIFTIVVAIMIVSIACFLVLIVFYRRRSKQQRIMVPRQDSAMCGVTQTRLVHTGPGKCGVQGSAHHNGSIVTPPAISQTEPGTMISMFDRGSVDTLATGAAMSIPEVTETTITVPIHMISATPPDSPTSRTRLVPQHSTEPNTPHRTPTRDHRPTTSGIKIDHPASINKTNDVISPHKTFNGDTSVRRLQSPTTGTVGGSPTQPRAPTCASNVTVTLGAGNRKSSRRRAEAVLNCKTNHCRVVRTLSEKSNINKDEAASRQQISEPHSEQHHHQLPQRQHQQHEPQKEIPQRQPLLQELRDQQKCHNQPSRNNIELYATPSKSSQCKPLTKKPPVPPPKRQPATAPKHVHELHEHSSTQSAVMANNDGHQQKTNQTQLHNEKEPGTPLTPKTITDLISSGSTYVSVSELSPHQDGLSYRRKSKSDVSQRPLSPGPKTALLGTPTYSEESGSTCRSEKRTDGQMSISAVLASPDQLNLNTSLRPIYSHDPLMPSDLPALHSHHTNDSKWGSGLKIQNERANSDKYPNGETELHLQIVSSEGIRSQYTAAKPKETAPQTPNSILSNGSSAKATNAMTASTTSVASTTQFHFHAAHASRKSILKKPNQPSNRYDDLGQPPRQPGLSTFTPSPNRSNPQMILSTVSPRLPMYKQGPPGQAAQPANKSQPPPKLTQSVAKDWNQTVNQRNDDLLKRLKAVQVPNNNNNSSSNHQYQRHQQHKQQQQQQQQQQQLRGGKSNTSLNCATSTQQQSKRTPTSYNLDRQEGPKAKSKSQLQLNHRLPDQKGRGVTTGGGLDVWNSSGPRPRTVSSRRQSQEPMLRNVGRQNNEGGGHQSDQEQKSWTLPNNRRPLLEQEDSKMKHDEGIIFETAI